MWKLKTITVYMAIMEFKIIGTQKVNGKAGVMLKALDGVVVAIIEGLPENAVMVTLSAEATAMVYSAVECGGTYAVKIEQKHVKEVSCG